MIIHGLVSLITDYSPAGYTFCRCVHSLGICLIVCNPKSVGLDIVPLYPNLEEIDPILAWRVTWIRANLYVHLWSELMTYLPRPTV